MYRGLRATSPASALFGSALGVMGLGVLAAGALPQVARVPISDLYHAPGATPEDQGPLVLLWQVAQGIFDALLVTGLLLLPIGLLTLGVAMLRTPAFGKAFGEVSVVLGVIGVAAGVVLLIDPGSPIAVVVAGVCSAIPAGLGGSFKCGTDGLSFSINTNRPVQMRENVKPEIPQKHRR